MSVLWERQGLQKRPVPLTHGQNVAKQLAWFGCKVLIATVLIIGFVALMFAL